MPIEPAPRRFQHRSEWRESSLCTQRKPYYRSFSTSCHLTESYRYNIVPIIQQISTIDYIDRSVMKSAIKWTPTRKNHQGKMYITVRSCPYENVFPELVVLVLLVDLILRRISGSSSWPASKNGILYASEFGESFPRTSYNFPAEVFDLGASRP